MSEYLFQALETAFREESSLQARSYEDTGEDSAATLSSEVRDGDRWEGHLVKLVVAATAGRSGHKDPIHVFLLSCLTLGKVAAEKDFLGTIF